jgi:hypothetical protein
LLVFINADCNISRKTAFLPCLYFLRSAAADITGTSVSLSHPLAHIHHRNNLQISDKRGFDIFEIYRREQQTSLKTQISLKIHSSAIEAVSLKVTLATTKF